jgi:hypothetical protein
LLGAALGLALTGKLGASLKFGVVALAALAASGIAVYYTLYLPFREAQLANERLLEEARRHAAENRLLAQEQDAQEHQAAAKAAAQARYQSCVAAAQGNHDTVWAAECKRRSEQIRQDHDDCLNKLKLPQTYCDTSYVVRDDSPTCTLPGTIGTVFDADLERARNRCLRDSQTVLQ